MWVLGLRDGLVLGFVICFFYRGRRGEKVGLGFSVVLGFLV